MKNIRKLLCAVLAIAVLCASVIPALADEKPAFKADWSTLYLLDKAGERYSLDSIAISNITEKTKITDPKSSNKSVVSIYSVDRGRYTEEYYESEDHYESNYAYLYVRPRKVGSATVSVKIDGATYSKKVSVSKYVNPVKSFVISGISGANIKGAFNDSAYGNCTLSADAKAGSLKVAAASGWKVTSIYWNDNDTGENYEYYNWKKGVGAVTMHLPAMSKDKAYSISVNFRNVKTGGTINLQYNINYDY